MQPETRWSWRTVAFAAAVLIASLGTQLPAQAQASSGAVELNGVVLDLETGQPVSGAVVHAVHLDTKQVYSAEPSDGRGRYELKDLPFGYFDIAVESSTGLFLANRVINAPAGERIEISVVLGEPQPEDQEWWSASPDRRVPGLDQIPDGVARIVEGVPRPGALTKSVADASRTGAGKAAGKSATQRKWLWPTVGAAGLLALAAIVDDDGDDEEDQGASPFQ